jgi:FtsH-binding integral membrane protein
MPDDATTALAVSAMDRFRVIPTPIGGTFGAMSETRSTTDLEFGTARLFSFAGFGMLLVSAFAGDRFRVGPFAMGWLFAIALAIGIGLGPIVGYFATVETAALTQAFAGTAATVAAAAALGFFLSIDFNFMRKHGTERDAIWLGTGIFVSIVNIFVSLLNIFSSN